MANFYSNEMTALTAKPSVPMEGPTRGGKKRIRVSKYEAADMAAGSTLYMDKLPKGARLLSGKLVTDALGSGVTLALGDGTTADRFLAATTCNTANLNTPLTPKIAEAEGGLDAEIDMILTSGGAAATGTIILVLEYIEAQD